MYKVEIWYRPQVHSASIVTMTDGQKSRLEGFLYRLHLIGKIYGYQVEPYAPSISYPEFINSLGEAIK